MNRYVCPLTPEQRQELEKFVWSAVWRIGRRALAILLSDAMFTIDQLTTICGADERSIRNWLDAYEAEGLQGLEEAPRSGRPRQTTSEQDQTIAQTVEQSPTRAGCLRTVWTVLSLGAHLVGKGIHIGPDTLRRRLHELQFRWRRPRLAILRRDPEGGSRMQRIMEAIFRASPDTHLLIGDETKMEHLPVLRGMWTRLASQFRIPTPEDNRFFYVFGVLNLVTGALTDAFFPKANRFAFIEFLEQILLAYPTGPILLILDHARYHTARDVLQWLEQHPRLTVLWLPKYAAELNPIEKLWWYLKNQVAANHCYATIEDLMKAVQAFLDQMDREEILQLTSLLPEKTFA